MSGVTPTLDGRAPFPHGPEKVGGGWGDSNQKLSVAVSTLGSFRKPRNGIVRHLPDISRYFRADVCQDESAQ